MFLPVILNNNICEKKILNISGPFNISERHRLPLYCLCQAMQSNIVTITEHFQNISQLISIGHFCVNGTERSFKSMQVYVFFF